MGIKFLCPHGHKLNVKSFLAGKKGVCPECGDRFIIPLESTPKQRVVSLGPTAGNSPGTDAGTHAGAVPGHSAAASAASVATWPTPSGQGPAPHPTPFPTATPPAAHLAPAMPAAVRADPLEDAPQATWYVRPPTGGQFGPAKGDLLKRWIAEGRVSADSLVWREGWAEWQTAGGLLSGVSTASSGMLAQAPAAPLAPYPSGAAAPVGVLPTASPSLLADSHYPTSVTLARDSTSTRPVVGKTPRSQLGLVIVIMLALIAILLMVALVIVIQSN